MKTAALRAAIARYLLSVLVCLLSYGHSRAYAGTAPTVAVPYLEPFYEIGILRIVQLTPYIELSDADGDLIGARVAVIQDDVEISVWNQRFDPPARATNITGYFDIPVGTTTLQVVATDLEGNSTSFTATFEVADTVAPTLTAAIDGVPVADGDVVEVDLRDGPVRLQYDYFDFNLPQLWKAYSTTSDVYVTYDNFGFNLNEAEEGSEIIFGAVAVDAVYNYSQPLTVTVRVVKKVKDKKDKDKPHN